MMGGIYGRLEMVEHQGSHVYYRRYPHAKKTRSGKMTFPEDLRAQFKSYIAERCGLYFRDHDLKNLEAGVSQRMKVCGLDSVHAYYIILTTSEEKEIEFRELLNLLTINHTYFFRNEPQFAALKEKVLKELIDRKIEKAFSAKDGRKPSLRIWSAGCSTGEEPYTIAMILREMIPHLEDWDIQIYATDASNDALGKAARGIYSEGSMRLVEEPCRSKYFTKISPARQSAGWQVSAEIKEMVNFGYLNLVADPFPPELDIIFCRNVTIYFELKTTISITDHFFESLSDPGYLFLGYSESLQFLTDKFKMASWQDGIYYRKAIGRPEPALPTLSWQPGEQEPEEEEYAEPSASSMASEVPEAQQASEVSGGGFEAAREKIVRLIYLKEYSQALDLIEKFSVEGEKIADIHYLVADIYANLNRHEEARGRLKRALAIDSFFAPAYYLLGCMYLEEEQNEKAKESFQKALYIDKDFVMARFYMAQLLRSGGRASEAIREYRNTLAVLSKGGSGPRSEMILQSSGFNAATLKSICCDNLERLKIEQ